MNDLAPPPLRAIAVVPRARRRGRWIGDVLLASLVLHLLVLGLFLFTFPEKPPPPEAAAPSIEIVMGDGSKTATTTETPEPEVGVGVTAAPPSNPSPPAGPTEPPVKAEPPVAPPEPVPVPVPTPVPVPETPSPPTPEVSPAPAPVTPPPAPTTPAPAPSTPAIVRLQAPREEPPQELPPLDLPAPPAFAPAAPRRVAPPRVASASPGFPRPTFSFGGGLGTRGTSGSARDHAATNLPAGSAALGRTNPNSGLAITGDNLGPDWASLMRAWWEQHKYYPREAAQQGQDGTVTVTVHMGPDGRVQQVELADRSGSQWLDLGALATFRGAKLPPFPWNETRKEAVMNFRIQYILIR